MIESGVLAGQFSFYRGDGTPSVTAAMRIILAIK